jgi:hypothetical protein
MILPYVVGPSYRGGMEFHFHSSKEVQALNDLDKVTGWIKGIKWGNFTTIEQAMKDQLRSTERKAESEFFRMQWFKKGTLHIWWKDEQLWREFNVRAARGKRWLGAE